jgi:hypothetical protein
VVGRDRISLALRHAGWTSGWCSADPSCRIDGVTLNELDWYEMLQFGGIALLVLIVIARILMRN